MFYARVALALDGILAYVYSQTYMLIYMQNQYQKYPQKLRVGSATDRTR